MIDRSICDFASVEWRCNEGYFALYIHSASESYESESQFIEGIKDMLYDLEQIKEGKGPMGRPQRLVFCIVFLPNVMGAIRIAKGIRHIMEELDEPIRERFRDCMLGTMYVVEDTIAKNLSKLCMKFLKPTLPYALFSVFNQGRPWIKALIRGETNSKKLREIARTNGEINMEEEGDEEKEFEVGSSDSEEEEESV